MLEMVDMGCIEVGYIPASSPNGFCFASPPLVFPSTFLRKLAMVRTVQITTLYLMELAQRDVPPATQSGMEVGGTAEVRSSLDEDRKQQRETTGEL